MRRFFSPYRVLKAMPQTGHFLLAAYVARMGMAMFGVAIVVMIATRRESYAVAGAVSFVGLASMAAGGPMRFPARAASTSENASAGCFISIITGIRPRSMRG